MRLPRYIVGLFVVAILSLNFGPGTATVRADTSSDPTLTGPNVIKFTPPDTLINPVVSLVQGTQLPDRSCSYSINRTLGAASASVEQEELARDLSTCLSLVERGTPASSSALSMSAAASQPNATVTRTSSSPIPKLFPDCSDGQLTPGVHCTQLTLDTWYQDPISLHVNDVYTYLSWNWDGSTICTFPNISEAETVDTWLLATGWDETSHTEDHEVTSCSQIHNLSYATFTNHPFCPTAVGPILGPAAALGIVLFAPTVTNYAPVGLYGNPDGTGQLVINVSASGGCQNLLTDSHRLTQVVDGQPVVQ